MFLVTGAMGCLGAWTLYHLIQQGQSVVSFDLNTNRHRLNLLLSPQEQERILFEFGDLRDPQQIDALFTKHSITHVIHLAALQVPFCRANPVLGAQVNVVGTVNLFESARQQGLSHIAYASSIAVYGKPEHDPDGLIAHDAPFDPQTLYGIYKQANEGTARIYWQDYGLGSTCLRPYTVYGVGRDQGLTSEPTQAMLAAAQKQDYTISFGGQMQFQWASDVAQAFILAASKPLDGAYGLNLGTPVTDVQTVAQVIMEQSPDVQISVGEQQLPFPVGFDDSEFRRHFPDAPQTPLDEGIAQTIQHFEACFADGRLLIE